MRPYVNWHPVHTQKKPVSMWKRVGAICTVLCASYLDTVPAGLSSPNIQNSPFFAAMSNSPASLVAAVHRNMLSRAWVSSACSATEQGVVVTAPYRKKVMNNCAHKGKYSSIGKCGACTIL